MQVFFDLGGGDFRCSGQIDHVAVGLQEVKLTGPVISHHKGVYVVFFDIGYFLIPEENWEQKISDVKEFRVDTFVMGSDWEGKFDFLKPYCDVVYLPRTPEISSTQIKQDLHK